MIKITQGSGNVFADLELPNADWLLNQAQMDILQERLMGDK